MYSDGIDDDESGIGNLLLVAVMSCIDPSAVQTARMRCAKSCLRTRTQVRIHTGIKYVFERRPVFVDKIAGSWMPANHAAAWWRAYGDE